MTDTNSTEELGNKEELTPEQLERIATVISTTIEQTFNVLDIHTGGNSGLKTFGKALASKVSTPVDIANIANAYKEDGVTGVINEIGEIASGAIAGATTGAVARTIAIQVFTANPVVKVISYVGGAALGSFVASNRYEENVAPHVDSFLDDISDGYKSFSDAVDDFLSATTDDDSRPLNTFTENGGMDKLVDNIHAIAQPSEPDGDKDPTPSPTVKTQSNEEQAGSSDDYGYGVTGTENGGDEASSAVAFPSTDRGVITSVEIDYTTNPPTHTYNIKGYSYTGDRTEPSDHPASKVLDGLNDLSSIAPVKVDTDGNNLISDLEGLLTKQVA